jgi:hypothetical protein
VQVFGAVSSPILPWNDRQHLGTDPSLNPTSGTYPGPRLGTIVRRSTAGCLLPVCVTYASLNPNIRLVSLVPKLLS